MQSVVSEPVTQFLIHKIESPDAFGEIIRDYAFVTQNENDIGCYDTFDLRKSFKPIPIKSELGKKMIEIMQAELPYDTPQLFTNGHFFVGWWWDGDGTLVVGCRHQNAYKFAVNEDCKKTYFWKWGDEFSLT